MSDKVPKRKPTRTKSSPANPLYLVMLGAVLLVGIVVWAFRSHQSHRLNPLAPIGTDSSGDTSQSSYVPPAGSAIAYDGVYFPKVSSDYTETHRDPDDGEQIEKANIDYLTAKTSAQAGADAVQWCKNMKLDTDGEVSQVTSQNEGYSAVDYGLLTCTSDKLQWSIEVYKATDAPDTYVGKLFGTSALKGKTLVNIVVDDYVHTNPYQPAQ